MKQSATETRLYCPRCGTIHTIFRKTAKQKKAGHYKNFYCYKCAHTHNHIELKDFYTSMPIYARAILALGEEK